MRMALSLASVDQNLANGTKIIISIGKRGVSRVTCEDPLFIHGKDRLDVI